jgi:SpoVK/Ycf46/Vps4 family AAA+-type ATPase
MDLPSGAYKIFYLDWEIAIRKIPVLTTDKYVNLSYSTQDLVRDINLFIKNINLYHDLGLRPRRGCLIYGPPGNGKTFQIIRAIKEAQDSFNSAIFFIGPEITELGDLLAIRETLYGRNVIFVIEELTQLTQGNTSELLNFLDGEFGWDNCYTIATTNYPEQLPANIIDRPGRFDLLIKFDNPDTKDRDTYLSALLGEPASRYIVENTEGLSIAYLKELVLRSRFYNKTLEETNKEMRARKQLIKTSFADKGDFAF